MAEAVRSGQILPEVMKVIEQRMQTRHQKDTETSESAPHPPSEKAQNWQFDRQINVSTLVQLAFLASLIVGSWLNLQRQLDLLQRDVSMLLRTQKDVQQKIALLSAQSISYEYRLQALEKGMFEADSTFSP